MPLSSRFTVALHILTLLAWKRGEPVTSEFAAASVNTNPVVIRRLLGLLKRKGLVSSRPGAGGGWELARDPDRITLLDVRRALGESGPFALHSQPPNPACPVGRRIQSALGRVYGEAERAMERELVRTTVGGLLRRVTARRR